MIKWLFLIGGIIFNALASILIKAGALKITSYTLDKFIFNIYLIIGIISFFIAFLFFALALTKLPLNIVHPVMTSFTVMFVSLASFFIFHEFFNFRMLIGIIFIIIGVFLLTIK